jgi:type II secretory pathway component PulF
MNSSESIKRKASVRLNDMQAATFCELFAQGLSSGLGYSRVIAMLERKKISKDILSALRQGLLVDGMRLSEVFQQYGLLDRNIRALVDVGEDQGNLPSVFEGQIPIYRERYRRKKSLLMAFAEPAILMFLGMGVLGPILSNLTSFSKFKGWKLFQELLSTIMVPSLVMCIVLTLMGAMGLWWLDAPVDKQNKAGSFWLSVPILSAPSRLYAQSQMARYLAISLRSGMDIFQSVQLSIQASNDPRLIPYVDHVMASLEEGLTLEAAMVQIPYLHEDLLDYLSVGEETGRMSDMLLQSAELLKTKSDDLFNTYMTAFSYAMRMVLIVSIIGYIIFGVIAGELGAKFSQAVGKM